MSNASFLALWLGQIAAQLPVTLIGLAGCIIALIRWQQAPARAGWTLAGFGLVVVLGVLLPSARILLQRWMTESHAPVTSVGITFAILGLASSVLYALSYFFLLLAIFSGRQLPSPPPPPLSGDAGRMTR